jgi:hypothetical protein
MSADRSVTAYPPEFVEQMREAQERARPHRTVDVVVCRFCGADTRPGYGGIRRSHGRERSDGMYIEYYVQTCCGRPTPFKNGVTPDGTVVVARTVEEDHAA